MNSKSIALTATFAATAIALNVIRIPTPYWPGIFYSVYEIPVVVAFLLLGAKIGLFVEVLHVAGQLVFFPVGLLGFAGYPMGFVAMLLMFAGMHVGNRIATRRAKNGKSLDNKKLGFYMTVFAALFRGVIMPFLDYVLLYQVLLPLVGVSIPETQVMALVPGFFVFNVTYPLYSVPIAYFVAAKASKTMRIQSHSIINS